MIRRVSAWSSGVTYFQHFNQVFCFCCGEILLGLFICLFLFGVLEILFSVTRSIRKELIRGRCPQGYKEGSDSNITSESYPVSFILVTDIWILAAIFERKFRGRLVMILYYLYQLLYIVLANQTYSSVVSLKAHIFFWLWKQYIFAA